VLVLRRGGHPLLLPLVQEPRSPLLVPPLLVPPLLVPPLLVQHLHLRHRQEPRPQIPFYWRG
jgi:hypothetical protein